MTARPRVLAGFDGTAASRRAIDWAATQAARRAWPLTISMAHADPVDTYGTTGPGSAPTGTPAAPPEWTALHEVARAVQADHPTLEIVSRYVHETAVDYLTEQSSAPGLIVIGTRGLGWLQSVFSGGVSARVAAKARGAIVVVPDRAPTEGAVVVGVDGDATQAAVRWAVDHAGRNDALLRLVRGIGQTHGLPLSTAAAVLPDAAPLQRTCEQAQADLIEEVRRRAPGLVVEGDCTRGDPAQVLVDESRHARLLVVGSRGRGPLRGLVLGSVSRRVLRETRCPTVVVPDDLSADVLATSR